MKTFILINIIIKKNESLTNTPNTCALFNKSYKLYSKNKTKSSLNPRFNFSDIELVRLPGLKSRSNRKVTTSINLDFFQIETIRTNVSYLRKYLIGTKGVFSESNYSAIVVPKSSTLKKLDGVSRDQRRTLLSKLSNYLMRSGCGMTSTRILNSALMTVNILSKCNINSNLFLKFLPTYTSIPFLNSTYKNSSIPIISKLIEGSINSIPRFFIKKHTSKLPGRKKNKTKGKPPVRNYLAFIKPHGRALLSLKWLTSDMKKTSKNLNLKNRILHLFINSIIRLDSKSYADKKIQTYRMIIAFLKKK